MDDERTRLERTFGEAVVTEFVAPIGEPLIMQLEALSYPGMGIYLFRSPRLYLAVRCGEVGQLGNGGHTHNDQLAIELLFDAIDQVRDSGTYAYSPSVDRRNAFRSTAAHFTPGIGDAEQNRWRPGQRGLFSLVRGCGGRCEYAGHDGFIGSHSCFGRPVVRFIQIRPDRIVIRDYGADSAGMVPTQFSNGYGRWIR